jgi:cathepsin D
MKMLGNSLWVIFLDEINIDENCKGLNNAPALTFIMDGIHYDLGPNDYVMKIDA